MHQINLDGFGIFEQSNLIISVASVSKNRLRVGTSLAGSGFDAWPAMSEFKGRHGHRQGAALARYRLMTV